METTAVIKMLVENRVVEIGLAMMLLAVVFIALERFVSLVLLAERRILNSALAMTLYNLKGDIPKVSELVAGGSCILAGVIRHALASGEKSSIRSHLDNELYRLNRVTALAGLIATIAPLAGLLGTVGGMVMALGAEDSVARAAGVSSALTTTAAGIVVAMVAHATAHFSEHRATNLIVRIEQIANEGI